MLRILIADDHTLIRQGARAILQAHQGWRVVGEAKNGREAIQRAKKLKPHIAIVDLSMPGVDGVQAIREICRELPATKIIVLTMHVSSEMVQFALDEGAHAYILKSDLRECLVKAVKAVGRGKRSLTPSVSKIVLEDFLKNGKAQRTAQPTRRESDVIRLLAEERTNKEIAAHLGLAVTTVQTHRANIMQKLGFRSLADLIRYGLRHGIVLTSGESKPSGYVL